MPRKYVPKKKKFYRRSRRYKRSNKLSFYKAPLPNMLASKMRYVENISINPGFGLAGVYVVSANGMYDPNFTGTGHQPRGFDQIMSMYDHYTVIGSKIVVEFTPTGNYNSTIFVSLKDSVTGLTANDYLEGRNVSSAVLQPTGNGHVKTLSKTFSARKFLGVSHPMSSSLLRGSDTSNPSEQAYYHIGIKALQAVDESEVQINFRVEYLVIYTEPKQPTQS